MTAPVAIAIAVVEHRGLFLVGQRPEGVPLAGMAEFPGGKLLPGESPEQAAVRECLEESQLAVEVVERFPDVVHDYPHGQVHLHFLRCRLPVAETSLLPRPAPPFCWVPREDLAKLNFPEANRALVATLSRLP
jgi:mutator protein MutT